MDTQLLVHSQALEQITGPSVDHGFSIKLIEKALRGATGGWALPDHFTGADAPSSGEGTWRSAELPLQTEDFGLSGSPGNLSDVGSTLGDKDNCYGKRGYFEVLQRFLHMAAGKIPILKGQSAGSPLPTRVSETKLSANISAESSELLE